MAMDETESNAAKSDGGGVVGKTNRIDNLTAVMTDEQETQFVELGKNDGPSHNLNQVEGTEGTSTNGSRIDHSIISAENDTDTAQHGKPVEEESSNSDVRSAVPSIGTNDEKMPTGSTTANTTVSSTAVADMGYEEMSDLEKRHERRAQEEPFVLVGAETPFSDSEPTVTTDPLPLPKNWSASNKVKKPKMSSTQRNGNREDRSLTPRQDNRSVSSPSSESRPKSNNNSSRVESSQETGSTSSSKKASDIPHFPVNIDSTPQNASPVRRRRPKGPILRTCSASSNASSVSSGERRNILQPARMSFRNCKMIGEEMDLEQDLTGSDVVNSLLGLALQLTSQEWSQLGKSTSAATENCNSQDDGSGNIDYLEFQDLVDRITALLLVRLIPVASPARSFPDLSTTTICRTVLVQSDKWPQSITMTVLKELQAYVRQILHWYRSYVPYHNAEHAYHVTVSANKLLDLMLGKQFGQKDLPPTFGLRHDPLSLLSLIWAALIHDVDHHGVPNRQLATEKIDNPLAIRYNDQSIAENQSLFLAFDELLHGTTHSAKPASLDTPPKPLYENLREVMCPKDSDYFSFRKNIINLVLHTDIASPEKAELSKSKFKAANFESPVSQHHDQKTENGEEKTRGTRRRHSKRMLPQFQNKKKHSKSGEFKKRPPSRSISNTLHNASHRLGSADKSESEISSEMSNDETTTESSEEVSEQTEETAITSVSGSQPLKPQEASASPDCPQSDKRQPLRLAEAMKDGVQVTVKTASASDLGFTASEARRGGRRDSSNNATSTATSPARSEELNDASTSTCTSPDKIPAVPQRRLSTAANSYEITTAKHGESLHKNGVVARDQNEQSCSPSSGERVSDKAPSAPQRKRSQEPPAEALHLVPTTPSVEISSSTEIPLETAGELKDQAAGTTNSDKTPLVPRRRGSVVTSSSSAAATTPATENNNKKSSTAELEQHDDTSATPIAIPVSVDGVLTTRESTSPIRSITSVADKTPAFPQRRMSNAMDHTTPVAGKDTEKLAATENVKDTDATHSTSKNRALKGKEKLASSEAMQDWKGRNQWDLDDPASLAVAQRRLSGGLLTSRTSKSFQEYRRRHSSGLDGKNILKRKKLGIRRSMDLSGEMLQPYHPASLTESLSDDKPDELKASVVMETIMAAADISQNMQSFEHMEKWSNKLFMELRRAHVAGRGPDVSQNWFRNQIGFLEHYVMPLAKKLDEIGVFGPVIGPSFARLVKANRDKWILDGEKVTYDVVEAGKKAFPDGTPIPEDESQPFDPRVDRVLKQADGQRLSTADASGDEPTSTDASNTSKALSPQSIERELLETQKKIKTMMKDHEQEIAKIASNHHSKIDDLERELIEMTEEYERARAKISKLRKEREEDRKSSISLMQKESEIAHLRKKLLTREKENDELKKQIDCLSGGGCMDKQDSKQNHSDRETFLSLEKLQLLDGQESLCLQMQQLIAHYTKEETRLTSVASKHETEEEKVNIKNSLKLLLTQYEQLTKRIEVERRRLVEEYGGARVAIKTSLMEKSESTDRKLSEFLPDRGVDSIKDGIGQTPRVQQENLNPGQKVSREDKDVTFNDLKELLLLQQKHSLELQETLRAQIQDSKSIGWFSLFFWVPLAVSIGTAFVHHATKK